MRLTQARQLRDARGPQLNKMQQTMLDSDLLDISATQADPSEASSDEVRDGTIVFDLVRDIRSLCVLEHEWQSLFQRASKSHNVFQAFSWVKIWAQHYAMPSSTDGRGEVTLFVLTGRVNGRLVLVWPLAKTKSFGMCELVWAGAPASQYGDILMDADASAGLWLSEAVEHLGRHSGAGFMALGKVRDDSTLARHLPGLGAIVTQKLAAPFVNLREVKDLKSYLTRFSSRTRKNRRRQRRRLSDIAPVTFTYLKGGEETQTAVSTAIALKKDWLQSRGQISPTLQDKRFEAFFVDAASSGHVDIAPRVSVLSCGDEPAAIEVSFVHKGHLHAHLATFDAKYYRDAPGALQQEDTLAACFSEGLSQYDLLAPADAYKMEWSDNSVGVRDYVIAFTTPALVLARGYHQILRPSLKRLYNAIPSEFRRRAIEVLRNFRAPNR